MEEGGLRGGVPLARSRWRAALLSLVPVRLVAPPISLRLSAHPHTLREASGFFPHVTCAAPPVHLRLMPQQRGFAGARGKLQGSAERGVRTCAGGVGAWICEPSHYKQPRLTAGNHGGMGARGMGARGDGQEGGGMSSEVGLGARGVADSRAVLAAQAAVVVLIGSTCHGSAAAMFAPLMAVLVVRKQRRQAVVAAADEAMGGQ
ncbi:unnamed protein product [Closterium sp. NIES-64]|nr:unnamed protein product [Closterium sp. NIES-64]